MKKKSIRARYRDKDVGDNNAGITEEALRHIITATEKKNQLLSIREMDVTTGCCRSLIIVKLITKTC